MKLSDNRIRRWLARFGASFSFVGLAVAGLFFAASLTPSLLPRHYAVEGVLAGAAAAVGYGLGKLLVALWHLLGIPDFPAQVQRYSKWTTGIVVLVVAIGFLWRTTLWQNSIRQLMEMEPVETAYPTRVALIALVTGLVLVVVGRAIRFVWNLIHRGISRWVPRRVSYFLTTGMVVLLLFLVVNKVVARYLLRTADTIFLRIDAMVDEGIEPPTESVVSGSAESLVDWDTIGRRGKNFLVGGPTQEEIASFWDGAAERPLRIYVGWGTAPTKEERAKIALDEMIRVGAFDRSLLVVATPTGTGWLDEGAVDTIEYLHRGDTAIVSMQYSYLPSWITILVDPVRSCDSAEALFNEVYAHWKTLPPTERPKLYLHGLSLGSLGSEVSADLFTVFEDPIQGAVWSGPPFASSAWGRAVRYRNADSPMWLPKFRDGSMLRFTGQQNALPDQGERWGPMRFVYIQYASDPMTFFSPTLLYRRPAWLAEERGPDVSPYLRWYPIVTFLQTGFDLPMATAVPTGYGHNISPANYIDAWIEVTEPSEWDPDDTRRLKERFAE